METPKAVLVADVIAYHEELDRRALGPIIPNPVISEKTYQDLLRNVATDDTRQALYQMGLAANSLAQRRDLYSDHPRSRAGGLLQGLFGGAFPL